MKKFLKENFQIKSKIIFLFLIIGVVILIFFLNFVYKNYKRNYLIQETRKRKIEMEKEQLKREEESEKSNKKIEDDFLFFEHTLIGKLKLEPSLKLQSINKRKYFSCLQNKFFNIYRSNSYFFSYLFRADNF